MPSQAQIARNRLAVASRLGDTEKAREARADLAVAKITQYVDAVVSTAPPLTAEQREAIIAAFAGFSAPSHRREVA